jgi:hypothetical protein
LAEDHFSRFELAASLGGLSAFAKVILLGFENAAATVRTLAQRLQASEVDRFGRLLFGGAFARLSLALLEFKLDLAFLADD